MRLPVAVEDGLGLEDAVADGAGGLALRPLLVCLHVQPQHARPLEGALAHGARGGLLAVGLKQYTNLLNKFFKTPQGTILGPLFFFDFSSTKYELQPATS